MKTTASIISVILLTIGWGSLAAQEDTTMQRDRKATKDTIVPPKANTTNPDIMLGAGNKTSKNKNTTMTADLTGWPEASRMAVEEITAKYGQPDGVTADELIWMDKGVWKKICITKTESKHNFPIQHTDMLTTTVSYRVPTAKMDDLGMFDGSVTFDRTQGTMSARCDKEANNFLALNLAYDIIKSKLSVQQARVAYGNIVKQKMNGENPPYMQKLIFAPQFNAIDPDTNTTGLTKEDVMKGKVPAKTSIKQK